MTRRWMAFCVAGTLALVGGAGVQAADEEPSPLQLSYIETPDVKLIYFDGLRYLTPYVIRSFTNATRWQQRTFAWKPSQRTTLLLNDYADAGSAYATQAPRNLVGVDVAPLSYAFETQPAVERFYYLMNHEMVHTASGDVASAEDRFWRGLFRGKVPVNSQHPETLLYSYLTIPRFNTPRWWNEGIAVFLETWMNGGSGRAQGGYDEMVFRAMVRDNAVFYDPLGLASHAVRTSFQVGAMAYLYGGRFITYLAWAHSPQKVVEWIRRGEGSRRYYSDEFERVFGKTLEAAWADWIAFERQFQARNLTEVRKNPITPMQTVVAKPLGSVSRLFRDPTSGLVVGAFKRPGVVDHIGLADLKTGQITPLVDLNRAALYTVTSLAFDAQSRTVFYVDDANSYRDLKALDLATGTSRVLFKDARIGQIAFNPVDKSLWGVRTQNGATALVRLEPPYDTWNRVHEFPYQHVPFDLDISADGKWLSASMGEFDGEQYLRVWPLERLAKGDLRPSASFNFGSSTPESFVFSPDGRYLYGSSYYTGASNIFRYEHQTDQMEAVSNAETGFFRPLPMPDGKLLVLGYTGEGFIPGLIEPRPLKDVSAVKFLGNEVVEKHPVVKTWQVPSPSTVDADKLITRQGPYHPLRHIELENAFPVLQGYRGAVGPGVRLNFSDPAGYSNISLLAAYTPDSTLKEDEKAHFELSARYLTWTASLSWNRSDFYDIFGPTKRARKGLAARLGYTHWFTYDPPKLTRLETNVAFFDKIDTLPDAQNVGSGGNRLWFAEVAYRHQNPKRSLGAVDEEKGLNYEAVLHANRAQGSPVPQARVRVDYGIPLPYGRSSLWLRTAGGASRGERTDPFANWYFGGFGNNYVDNREIKRYRDHYALPGFGLNEVSGQSFVRQMVELNLPPTIFERVGTPGAYAAWLRGSVFAAGLWTDPASPQQRRNYASIGTQWDLRFSVLHWYDMTLSLGYATGFRGGRRAGDEWMLSLKVL